MPYQLVRTDTDFPCKIPLTIGEHILGRGPLLSCDDKRVSRKHGKLLVTEQSITLESIHENPCFYTNAEEKEATILKKGGLIQFKHGDKFGLLPNLYWYEIMKIVSDDNIVSGGDEKNQNGNHHENKINMNEDSRYNSDETRCNGDDTKINDETRCNGDETKINNDETRGNDEIRSNCDLNSTNDNIEIASTVMQVEKDLSEDLELNTELNNRTFSDLPPSPSMIHDCPTQITNSPLQSTSVQISPEKILSKRSSDGLPSGEKRIKLEPQDGEPAAGGSSEAVSEDPVQVKAEPSSSSVKNEPNSPDKPKQVLRERCMYGASCYRKNPVHKASFSHPCDPDWGPGAKAPCPHGALCIKRDPRHWRDHEHPHGTKPPQQQHQRGFKVVERHGNIFYINANTVNFYDDHFNVNDSDGDSVDYDYEF